jgi:uncharacterized protein YceK
MGFVLTGCGTINTVFSSDVDTVNSLRKAKTRCEAVPRVYSGLSYDLCVMHGPPQVTERDPAAPAMIPFQIIDLIPSGIIDTLLLPYTIYLQSSLGSLDI